jgi:hybrid cluster-associated redox disulfide protein
MAVYEIVTFCPDAADIMAAYGLHCFSCSIGGVETLTEGCVMHGFDDETTAALVDDLNEALRSQPPRPATLTVTKEAAAAVAALARLEKKERQVLAVIPDQHGGFCLEFQDEPGEDHQAFSHPDVPSVRVFATPLTLWRIGGAIIDYREGRFKLDLPDDDCCGGKHEGCGCR